MSDPSQKLHTPVLETARLILRPARYEDAPIIQKRFGRWEVIRYLNRHNVPWPYPNDGAETFLRGHIPKVEAGITCGWMLCLKNEIDDPIGHISLDPSGIAARDMRGFWLDVNHWGHGYMTEAADRVVDFAFQDLRLPVLWVNNALENTRSAGVKQRQGAELVETAIGEYVAGDLPKQIWRIDREDWLARHPRP